MKKIKFLIGDTRAHRTEMKKNLDSKSNTQIIILTSIPLVIHQMTATMDMPTGNLNRGARASEITAATAASTLISIPAATLTAINGLITIYNAAAPSARKSAFNKMMKALKALMGTIQTAADLNPDISEALIKSCGFGVKKVAIKQKGIFTVKNGAEVGSIVIKAQGGGPYTCHDWMFSLDDVHFTRMAPTVAAKTTMSGLVAGTWVYITHELVTKKGGQGVSQVIKLLIK